MVVDGRKGEANCQKLQRLVVLDKDGQPAGVRYHVLPAMLLNELQRQQREIDELRAQVRALVGGKAAVRE